MMELEELREIIGSEIVGVDWDKGRTGTIEIHLKHPEALSIPVTLSIGERAGDPEPQLIPHLSLRRRFYCLTPEKQDVIAEAVGSQLEPADPDHPNTRRASIEKFLVFVSNRELEDKLEEFLKVAEA